jgi:DNA processing protein
MEKRGYWVGFNLVKGIGAVRMQQLIDYFGDVERAWFGSYQAFRQAGLSEKLSERIIEIRNQFNLDKYIETLARQNIKILIKEDPDYPRYLREIQQPPPVIYLRGNLVIEDDWAVAIVGTRRVTHYGKQIAEQFAKTLAEHHITVVSGLARGIDGVAHQAALNSGGRSIAVLGSGVDKIYPPEHKLLAQKMMDQGAIISDYPPGTPPESSNFPPRNRIISGISRAVIVIEAGIKSGALITADFAVDQGREVYAVPGNINSIQSKGTNQLIQNGARPLTDIRDLLTDLQVELIQEHQEFRKQSPSGKTESVLYSLLNDQPIHVDEIIQKAELSVSEVTAQLTVMELKGMVRHVGGMKYIKIREAGEEYQT